MAKYLPITTTSQSITHVNGNPVTPTATIAQWLSTHPNWSLYTYNNDPANYYTSLVCPDIIEDVTFTIDNKLTAEIFTGTPPQRPK